jgi:hypothetical protein
VTSPSRQKYFLGPRLLTALGYRPGVHRADGSKNASVKVGVTWPRKFLRTRRFSSGRAGHFSRILPLRFHNSILEA